MIKISKLNRNAIKIIALITMLIDHIGILIENLVPYYVYCIFRIIGRISFPLFAFFIAESCFYTHNKAKFAMLLLLFSILSQIPYCLMFNKNILDFNILFTFLISTILIFLYQKCNKGNSPNTFLFYMICVFVFILIIILQIVQITFEYGFYGIFLPVIFYLARNNRLKQIFSFAFILTIYVALNYLSSGYFPLTLINIAALLSVPLILFYNNQKGKFNLKYLFYCFYPVHLIILFIIKLIIY